jgi:hypothetical protein
VGLALMFLGLDVGQCMQFMLVYVGGEYPRLQFLSDAAFAAYVAAGGGISPPIPTIPFENWVWDLPEYTFFLDVPAFSPSQLVDAMMWASQHGRRVQNVPPLLPQFPRIRFSPDAGDVISDDDL